jgi:hypothetical protein
MLLDTSNDCEEDECGVCNGYGLDECDCEG